MVVWVRGTQVSPQKAEVQKRIIGGWISLSEKDHKMEECGTLLFKRVHLKC